MNKNKIKFNINLNGFFINLFMIFLVLKLTNLINWSWIWVAAPLWIPLAIVAIIVIIILICVGILKLIEKSEEKEEEKNV